MANPIRSGRNPEAQPSRPRGFRIGFQPSLSILFVVVVLGVGLAVMLLSLERARTITRAAAGTYLEKVAQYSADRVGNQFRSVADALRVLEQLPAIRSGAITDNAPLHRLLAAFLRSQPHIYNLYAGYEDGSFLELDALDHVESGVRKQLGAPDGAHFRLVRISAAAEAEPLRHTLYLDDDLRVLEEARRPADYDPRLRPWYRAAGEHGSSVTGPYVFAMGYIGYTVRQPLEGGRGVIAGDILLREAERFLAAERLAQTGVVLLTDRAGRLVAHPRLGELLRREPGGSEISLPAIAAAGIPGLDAALADWRRGGPAVSAFEAGGRTYLGAFRALAPDTGARLDLAVVAPLDEFFAEIEAARRSLTILGLAAVAASLPFVLWLGRALARSLIALAAETDRIQRFELSGREGRVASFIREIDDLGRSVATMRTVVSSFSRFVPKRLVKQLLETGEAMRLGGTRREVTVMFTDIDNFTDITEKRDPEQVMLFTSRYLAALSRAVMECRGTVDKFVGDAVMALWNAPAADPDHVANACAAALACVAVNRELDQAFASEGWPAYRTRFGIHTGEAVVGNIGSDDRMSYTVLGATVNLAARLEALNKSYGTRILVSEDVERRVGDRFVFRAVDRVRPKGFAADVAVYELCGSRAPVSREQPRASAAGGALG